MPGFFDSVLYPREFIALPLEFALLSFHISVTVLIAVKMRQGIVTYTHAFFHLYLIQCAANYMCYATLLVNRWSEIIDALTTNAVFRYSFNVLYQFSAYFEVAAFVPIAFNRWTAIVHPMAHQRIWKGSRFYVAVAFELLLPLFLALLRPMLALIYFVTRQDAFDTAWYDAGYIRHASLSITNFAVTAVNITLEAWSFLAYRRMDFAGKKHNRENFRLLLFTVLEMIPQTIKVVYYAMITYHHISPPDLGFLDTDDVFDAFINYLFSFQALCGPMFLFAMSSALRQYYKSFYRPGRSARITQVTPPSTISLAEWH